MATDSVTVSFDPTLNSPQSQIISGATSSSAGVMTAEQVQELTLLANIANAGFGPKIYSNLNRPAPNDPMFSSALADGRVAVIWNSTDKQPNYSDGVNWYNTDGDIT